MMGVDQSGTLIEGSSVERSQIIAQGVVRYTRGGRHGYPPMRVFTLASGDRFIDTAINRPSKQRAQMRRIGLLA